MSERYPARIAGSICACALLTSCHGGRGIPSIPSAQSAQQTYSVALASKFRVLHSFTGGSDGAGPRGALILKDGTLYGTTYDSAGGFDGVVFKMSVTGAETVLHHFTGAPDGAFPDATLRSNSAGDLFGTTSEGGFGAGVIFKVGASGGETVMYRFKNSTDGGIPLDRPLLTDLGLFGDTNGGGAACAPGSGLEPVPCGVVFKFSNGKESVLHTFTGLADGGQPQSDLIADSSGNLYGTTTLGGLADGSGCCGVVFKISSNGTETTLHKFNSIVDGANPGGGLVRDDAGNLYGNLGDSCGAVYKLAPSGVETILHRFTGNADGCIPVGTLVRDSNGNLYGNTHSGANGYGTVFKVSATGAFTTLHTFNGSDGEFPWDNGLVRDSFGNLYGVTYRGGAFGFGVVFEVTP